MATAMGMKNHNIVEVKAAGLPYTAMVQTMLVAQSEFLTHATDL